MKFTGDFSKNATSKLFPFSQVFKIATLKIALVKRTILLRSSRNSNKEIKVVQGWTIYFVSFAKPVLIER